MVMIEVYHRPGRGASVDDLLVDGLKSARTLIEEGKINDYSVYGMFSDHQKVIYFEWAPSHRESNMNACDWVSIELDSETTDVYNREFRFSGDLKKYRNSRMSLADYIFQHERTKEMREDLKPGQLIVWDPFTAEPSIVGIDDKRTSGSEWKSSNEILVPKSIILASEFRGYQKVASN